MSSATGRLDQLYQQLILDHARARHGRGLREPVAGTLPAQSHQVNPLCGDEVTVRIALDATPSGGGGSTGARAATWVVQDLSWEGEGCSISQAATSVLHDLVVGRTVPEAREVVARYRAMVRARGSAEPDEDVLGDAVAFAGVGRHANRVKCAMLGWTAFEDALLRSGAVAAQGTMEGSE